MKEVSLDTYRKFENALSRKIKGVSDNVKQASSALYDDDWKEVKAWLTNAQSHLTEAMELTGDLENVKLKEDEDE